MRSGLYNYTDSPIISKSLDNDPQNIWDSKEILRIAFSEPPILSRRPPFIIRTHALLDHIAEKIDNKPLEEIFQGRLFKPLGMKNTLLPKTNTLPAPFSHGYQYGSASYALVDTPYSPMMQIAGSLGMVQPNEKPILRICRRRSDLYSQ